MRASQIVLVVKKTKTNKKTCLPMQETKRHGFDPWVRKSPLEKVMATHSRILVWRIPRTEEPGGLWFLGSQRADTAELT